MASRSQEFEETERGGQTGGDCSFTAKASEVGTVIMLTAEKPGAAGFQTLASISEAAVLYEHLLCAWPSGGHGDCLRGASGPST